MKFPSYYETQKFMTVFTKAQYWSPFYATLICPHSSQHYPSPYTNFYHMVFSPRPSFPAKTSCIPLNDTTRATCTSHLPLLAVMTLITSSDGKNCESTHPSVFPILVLLLFVFRYSLNSVSRTFTKSR